MPYDPPPEIAGLSLAEVAQALADRHLPPVESWSPVATGASHISIAADGSWWHKGSRITRPAMVRAFASLLMCDATGKHRLVTPQQKLSIDVEDAAFIAVDCVQRDGALVFRLNTDELVVADDAHRVQVRGTSDAPLVYLVVRNGCEARLDRSTWLQLAEIALAQGDGSAVTSGGATFPLLPA